MQIGLPFCFPASMEKFQRRHMAPGAHAVCPVGGMAKVFLPICFSFPALRRGRNLDTIGQCEVQRSFRELREDITLMTFAAFLAELVSGIRNGQIT